MAEERSAERTAERARAIDLALTQIEKQFGKGSIMRLGAKDALQPVGLIPTGPITLDAALVSVCMPCVMAVEIFVPESICIMMPVLDVFMETKHFGS